MLMFRMPNKRKMSVQNEREMTGHCETLSASFRAKRGTSQKLLGPTNNDALGLSARGTVFVTVLGNPTTVGSLSSARLAMTGYSVRQKSWKRSRPFLIMSRLVA